MEYIFSKFRLHQIERFDGSDREYYNFAYDDFSNVTQITIGDKHGDSNNIKLVEYEYGANNGPLVKQTYGNTDSVSYTYDNLGRVKTATYSDGRELTYTYTGDGLLHSIKDGKLNVTYLYVYDTIGRLINSSKTNSSGILLLTQQEYNASNQLAGQSWQMGDTSYSESYTYNAADGSLNTMTTATGQTVNFGYDKLRRLLWVSNGLYTYSYTYRDLSDTQTTTQVQSLWYNGIAGGLGIHYTYDDLGNIKSYADYNGTWNYTYDDLNQLTQATIGNNTYTYTYDGFGNITSANGHTYAYENTYWDDLLTAYDGETITYDGSGNPTSYYNGTRWTFGWEEGRNLVSAAATGKQIFYTYDHEGIRTSKTVNGTIHNYVYASGKLLRETYGENVLDFFYDANGRPFALKYNGTVYYYILNVQGDVLRMVDADGTVVANYRYDPYGNILAATGDLAEINPLRYRGYYYDSDSNLFYLNARYYDPQIGRFINADEYTSTGQGLLGNNMFAYCGNNPAINVDTSGNFFFTALGAATGFVSGAITAMVTGQDKET